jgi:flagellar protein FlgJ
MQINSQVFINPADTQFVMDSSALNGLKTQAQKAPEKALEQVAEKFEALFIAQLLKESRNSPLKSDLLSSNDGDMYTEMLHNQWADSLAERKSLGLADLLVKQLSPSVQSLPAQTTQDFLALRR